MKEIKLTNSELVCWVDDEDFECLNKYIWRLHKAGYAYRKNRGRTIYMHDGVIKADMVDHKDRVKLNNQRSNLREATSSLNGINKIKNTLIKTTSQYKGVSWRKACNRWQCGITKNKIYIYIGLFYNEKEAALAYNTKAFELFGEFAVLNQIC